jgi:dTMP kinase
MLPKSVEARGQESITPLMAGFFISMEGMEGSGKSTQLRLLAEYLSRVLGASRLLVTREPGGTRIGEQIRDVVHSRDNPEMAPETELLLYSAARAQIVAQVIRPALAAGKLVLCDRFADSTLAYQGYGRNLDLEALRVITRLATGGLKPDLTLYIQVGIEEGLARRANGHRHGEELNRMDTQTREFYERVRQGYGALMQEEPARWIRIDGSQSVETVQTEIRTRIAERLPLSLTRL